MVAENSEKIADALALVAVQLKNLGNGNASTDMGAIEGLALQIKEASERIERGLLGIADAIDQHSSK